MKRKALIGFFALILVAVLAGCGKTETKSEEKKEEKAENFTIVCTSKEVKDESSTTQAISTYNFDKNQNVTYYKQVTKQQFTDKDEYNAYKQAQEQTVEEETDEETKFSLESDDDKMTLELTMIMDHLNVNDVEDEETKNEYKASVILKSSEGEGATCKIEGIERSQIK